MKAIRKRLTYANVMSSIAVFLILGGSAAIAASQIGKKSVGAPQLKSNAVTTAKIKKNAVTKKKIAKNAVDASKVKADSLTGNQINESTLGTVPSANTANALAGRTLFNVFSGAGTVNLATVGPFTVKGLCEVGAQITAKLQIFTAVNGASSTAQEKLDIATPAEEVVAETEPLNERGYQTEASEIAIGPEGLMMLIENPSVGVSVAGKPNQCQFVGVVSKLG